MKKQSQNSSYEVAPCMGTREVSPASETASLLHSPGKHICKKQLGRAQTTPCKLLANSYLLALQKTAIRLHRRGLFRVSLQETLIAAHIGKVTCLAAQIPMQLQSFFAKQQEKKKPKTKQPTSPVDCTEASREGLTAPTGHLIPRHVYS